MKFIEETLSGWGNFPRVRSLVAEARSIEDLSEAIRDPGITLRGLGRSYGDQAVNNFGKTIVLTKLNHFINFDVSSGILQCESGVSLEEIIEVCTPSSWFPKINPGTKFVTVGGAIANDIHGKAHHVDGTFVNCVLDFTILLADGSIVEASREINSGLFWATFGGLGLTGVIISVTMQLRKVETTYFTQKAISTKNLAHLLDSFEEHDHAFNYSVAWVDSLAKGKTLGRGVLTLGNSALLSDLPDNLRADPLMVSKSSKIVVPFYFPEIALNTLSIFFLNKVINFVQSSAGQIAHYEKFFYPLDAIHHWNRAYGKRGFIQYQFVIPFENGRKNIQTILEKISGSGCTPFLNVLKKMGKKQGLLSFPFEGYTFAIDFPVSKNLFPFISALDQIVLDFGGRIYLGKDALLNKNTFRAMYPEVEEWIKIKTQYDPKNVFSSNISRRLGLEAN